MVYVDINCRVIDIIVAIPTSFVSCTSVRLGNAIILSRWQAAYFKLFMMAAHFLVEVSTITNSIGSFILPGQRSTEICDTF